MTADHLKALRNARLAEDPSAHEEYTVEPLYLEVQARIHSQTGVWMEVQNTRHCVVYYVTNEAGSLSFDFEHQEFDVEGVIAALLEDFQDCPMEMMEVLFESGYRIPL